MFVYAVDTIIPRETARERNQPERLRGCEVAVNPRVFLPELADHAFLSRQIVQDDVNLLVSGSEGNDFLKEDDELAAGVVSAGFAMDSACFPIIRALRQCGCWIEPNIPY
jgi:hypothetical protein